MSKEMNTNYMEKEITVQNDKSCQKWRKMGFDNLLSILNLSLSF